MQNGSLPGQKSRDDVGKRGRRREEEMGPPRMTRSFEGKKRRRWPWQTVITQEIKISRIFHKAPVKKLDR